MSQKVTPAGVSGHRLVHNVNEAADSDVEDAEGHVYMTPEEAEELARLIEARKQATVR